MPPYPGHTVFWPFCLSICLSAKTFTLAISFDWKELWPSYFTLVYLVTRPFCWYQVQGHLLRSNIKVTVFGKMAVEGALV